ncbi:MAG: methyltransferase domain-containing protein [Anaerolineales bacterium]|nr:MAG: methyltransferase domain-containing protein [Anaerolineales bacterium]
MRNKKPLIFVAMSFDDKYYNMFNLIQAIAGDRGVTAVRADEEKTVIKKIRPGIFSKIRDADLIVAEISSGSPNVLYEVGWAHAMGKPTMLLAEKDVSIPFDINDTMVFKYDSGITPSALRRLLEIEFDKHLKEALQATNLKQPLVEMLGSLEEISSRDDLFTHLLGWTIEEFSQESRQWIGDSIRVNASDAIKKGIKVFQLLKSGGFATYLVPLNAFWKSDDKYSEECRLAAQLRDAKIERVFILPNHEALFSESLRNHVALDEDAGIRTYIAFIDNIPDKDAIQDFGLWDDELLCLIEAGLVGGETQVKGCTFGRNKAAIEKARLWQDTILSAAQPAPDLLNAIDHLDESTKLMLRSADIMKRQARRYCRGSYLTGNKASCEWYHASWQYLRILGLVSTPDWHDEFYKKSFTNAFNSGARDVLISGMADYSILDHLIRAIPSAMVNNVVISVLDICWTPIEICRWFDNWYEEKKKVHLNLRYNQRDALNTDYNDETFDLITTDAFLTRFDEEERERLVTEWHRILKGEYPLTSGRTSGILLVIGEPYNDYQDQKIADDEIHAQRLPADVSK